MALSESGARAASVSDHPGSWAAGAGTARETKTSQSVPARTGTDYRHGLARINRPAEDVRRSRDRRGGHP